MSPAGQPLPLRIWHTLKYEAHDPQGADAAVMLVRNSTPGNGDYLGLLGLGEHIYLPLSDGPGTTERHPDEVIAEFMKIATVAAEGGSRFTSTPCRTSPCKACSTSSKR